MQALPYIKAGKLNAIAVLGPKRSALLPQTLTVAESDVPGFALTNWFSLVVPSGAPREMQGRAYAPGGATK